MNVVRVGLWIVVTLAVTGCGYSFDSLLASDPDAGPVRSIWIPVIRNESHRRQFEEPLTDAVIKEIQATTDLEIKRTRTGADSELRLELIDVEEHTSIENRFDVQVQGSVAFVITVQWLDLRGNEETEIPLLRNLARDRRRFTATRGETFSSAAAEIAEKIAEKIVEGMYRGMELPPEVSGEQDA